MLVLFMCLFTCLFTSFGLQVSDVSSSRLNKSLLFSSNSKRNLSSFCKALWTRVNRAVVLVMWHERNARLSDGSCCRVEKLIQKIKVLVWSSELDEGEFLKVRLEDVIIDWKNYCFVSFGVYFVLLIAHACICCTGSIFEILIYSVLLSTKKCRMCSLSVWEHAKFLKTYFMRKEGCHSSRWECYSNMAYKKIVDFNWNAYER